MWNRFSFALFYSSAQFIYHMTTICNEAGAMCITSKMYINARVTGKPGSHCHYPSGCKSRKYSDTRFIFQPNTNHGNGEDLEASGGLDDEIRSTVALTNSCITNIYPIKLNLGFKHQNRKYRMCKQCNCILLCIMLLILWHDISMDRGIFFLVQYQTKLRLSLETHCRLVSPSAAHIPGGW